MNEQAGEAEPLEPIELTPIEDAPRPSPWAATRYGAAKRPGRSWFLWIGLGCAVPLVVVLGCGGLFAWWWFAAKARVEPVAERFLGTVGAEDYRTAYEMVGPEWKRVDTLESFTAFEQRLREITGPLQSKGFRGLNVQRTPTGGVAVLTYSVTFAKGSGVMTITLTDRGGSWAVVGHRVDSPVIAKALKCPSCGYQNKTLGRFCASCVKPLLGG